MGAGLTKIIIDGYDVSDYAETIEWSGSMDSAARSLRVVFPRELKPECGDEIKFYEDKRLLFKGKILYVDLDRERVSVEAYDKGIYLANNYVWGEYSGTAAQITKKVCASFGLKVGKLASTTKKVKVTSTGDMSIFAVIEEAYEGKTSNRFKQYVVYADTENKVCVEKMGADVAGDITDMIESGSRKWDAQSVVNKVVVLDSEGKKKAGVIENASDKSKYGTFQKTYRLQDGEDAESEAAKLLQTLEKSASVSCLGSYRYITGKGVQIKQKELDLNAKYNIRSDSHTWSSTGHIMDLEFYFAGDKINASRSAEWNVKYTDKGGVKKSAYLTAYCACDKCNGQYSRKDKSGVWTQTSTSYGGDGMRLYNKASYANKYCAITKKMKDDGVKYVLFGGVLYKTVDRHGTKHQDQYRVDIFHPSHSGCKELFNPGWKTIKCYKSKPAIYVPSSSSSVSSGDSEKRARAKIVSAVKKHKGEKYSETDCSDLIEKTFKEIGANIFPGAVAAEELRICEKAGVVKSVSKRRVASVLEKGDLLFWTGNSSRYKNIGHVGVYIGDGKIVDASSDKNAVVERNVWESNKYRIVYYADSYALLKKKGKI